MVFGHWQVALLCFAFIWKGFNSEVLLYLLQEHLCKPLETGFHEGVPRQVVDETCVDNVRMEHLQNIHQKYVSFVKTRSNVFIAIAAPVCSINNTKPISSNRS